MSANILQNYKRKPRKSFRSIKPMTEMQHQIALVKWAAQQDIKLIHIPNEGFRSAKTGAILKMMGLEPGFPDLFCPIPMNGYHGLFIEMKQDRVYSDSERKRPHWIAQEEWLAYLNTMGYYAQMAFGLMDGIKIIESYFKGLPPVISCDNIAA